MEIPQWHKDLVLDRIEKARLNPERMLDWEQASKLLTPSDTKTKSNIDELRKRHTRFLKLRMSRS